MLTTITFIRNNNADPSIINTDNFSSSKFYLNIMINSDNFNSYIFSGMALLMNNPHKLRYLFISSILLLNTNFDNYNRPLDM